MSTGHQTDNEGVGKIVGEAVKTHGGNGNGNVLTASVSLMTSDVDGLAARNRDFPATAELAEMLRPYYDKAHKSLGNGNPLETEGTHAASVSADRLPESLAKEVRTHLGELQSSAFTLEAHGATERAAEVREVASQLHSMLKVAQRFWQTDKPSPSPHTHSRK